LGQVYEQFLGKVIRLTEGHHAKIEEKPEVRKAGGVYYTPKYIVDYIVKNTVGKLIEGKNPKDVAKLCILDPACGSGSFLIQAYQYLMDWHLDWYSKNESEKHAKGKNPAIYRGLGGEWRLTTSERKRILLNNIYGVDIDSQAVEVTKLSLLLKVLEGESDQSLNQTFSMFHERALPDLQNNIKCGNSLIESDFYKNMQANFLNEEERYHVNIFDWDSQFSQIMKNGGFDIVIGNPPWGATLSDLEREYLTQIFKDVSTKVKDTYLYFILKSAALLRHDGILSFIVPNTWLLINNTENIRRLLLSRNILEIIDMGDGVFSQATVESAVFVMQNRPSNLDSCKAVRYKKGIKIVDHAVNKSLWLSDSSARIILELDEYKHSLLKRLNAEYPTFDKYCTITWGIKPYQVGYGSPPQTREMIDQRIYHSTTQLDKSWKPLLVGTNVNRYKIEFENNLFIKYGKWLMYPSNEKLMSGEKILMRQTSDRIRASLDVNGYYCQNSIFIIYSDTLNLKFLLGLLNSKLLQFMYIMLNPQTGKVFAEIKPSAIKDLAIVFDNDNIKKQKEITRLVDLMLQMYQKLSKVKLDTERQSIKRQISITDEQVNQLVYQLYSMSKEEIRIVEESTT
ncbi:MAG TPA: TaqI-like C-terminal specificity domain-containing protein, partial [Candidatus Acidoferrales bacterium]|nr:TaqI-like C-terminal specificity domain-containing protein [Candidatus Acidoferrales bacterium]